jgi:hypothetical protein
MIAFHAVPDNLVVFALDDDDGGDASLSLSLSFESFNNKELVSLVPLLLMLLRPLVGNIFVMIGPNSTSLPDDDDVVSMVESDEE